MKVVALFGYPYLFQNGDPKFHLEMVELGLFRGSPIIVGQNHKAILANSHEYWLCDYDNEKEFGDNLIPTYTVEDFIKKISELKQNSMETKQQIIPFDLERAKRITEGKEEGKIVTRDGRNARIICFDAKDKFPIIALLENEKGVETVWVYLSNGKMNTETVVSTCIDLYLSVPCKIEKQELKPFDKVLCRDNEHELWQPDLFGRRKNDGKYNCIGYNWNQCIPYEGNEHLLYTMDTPE